ncbi:MAG TPA: VWA domain-containing protein, partial [Methanotrichaceae archaeon]|nr:VWA domain-containing protein [Methanotrichaceae archaeon]
CYENYQKGQVSISRRRTPMADLPLGATEDRVVGSLNVERAIKEGIKALEPGILAAANRGILYIDEVNLLDDHVADVLLDAAAMGVNIVEREGVSVAHPARFMLVGTMNPEEGELRPQLLDRFGLQVIVEGIEDVDSRVEIARRAEQFDSDPEGFASRFEPAQVELRQKISAAREILSSVTMDDSLLRMIASTCNDMGIRTHRAEIVVSRTAKTIAALDGRTSVSHEDVRRAMELALSHRMRSRPFEPPTMNQERLEKSISKNKPPESQDNKDQKQEQRQEQRPEESSQDDSSQAESHPSLEKVFNVGDPIDVRQIKAWTRRDKAMRRKTSGRRMSTLTLGSSGRYLRHRFPRTGNDVAIDATIRAAAPYQRTRAGENAIKVKSEDIREKERVRKMSSVVLFVVDASGSMGADRRMEMAKGAVLSMLMDSYQKRDKVGMVAFKGDAAEILLSPCSSVDLAMKSLSEMPTGGKTPLSAGLSRGLQILQGEIRKDSQARPMMVLVSDGRANVALSHNMRNEIMEISGQARQAGVHTVVIDTEVVTSSFMDMRLGYCRDIAEASGGKYYPLSSLSPDALSSIVEGEHNLLLEVNN